MKWTIPLPPSSAATPSLFFGVVFSFTVAGEPLDAFLDRNVYVRERKAAVLITPPNTDATSSLRTLTIRVEDVGRELWKKTYSLPERPQDRLRAVIPLTALPFGEYRVHVALHGEDNRSAAAAADLMLRKAPPPPAGVRIVRADREHGIVLLDGAPFFPLGCCGIPENWFRRAADAGFNCTVRWGAHASRWTDWLHNNPDDEKARLTRIYLDKARDAGILVIEFPMLLDWGAQRADLQYVSGHIQATEIFTKQKLPWILNAVKDHPALLAYYGPDEPDCAGNSERWVAALRSYYHRIRAADPYHPVFFLFDGYGVQRWKETFDIAGNDYYPMGNVVRGSDERPVNLLSMVARVQKQAAIAAALHTPLWIFPLCRRYRLFPAPFQEQRLQTYLAIIGGARGLIWWVWGPRTPENWNSFRVLLHELRDLTPVLTAPDVRFEVHGTPELESLALPVLIRNSEGRAYVITANAARRPMRVRFSVGRVPELRSVRTVHRLFPTRQVRCVHGAWTEVIESFGVRIYEIPRRWPAGGRLDLTAAILPAERRERKASAVPVSPYRNLVQDPSFVHGDLLWRRDKNKRRSGSRGEEASVKFSSIGRSGRSGGVTMATPRSGGRIRLESQSFRLSPQTRYILVVDANMWGAGGASGCVRIRAVNYLSGPGRYEFGKLAQIPLPNLAPVPERHFVLFDTPPGGQSFAARVWCELTGGPARAWLRAVQVKRAGDTRNLVLNPGFERQTVPGVPDDWTREFYVGAGEEGTPDGPVAIDPDAPWQGKVSLRLKRESRRASDFPRKGDEVSVSQIIKPFIILPDTPFTFSFYARADRSGLPLYVSCPDYNNSRSVRIQSTWRRYIFPVKRKTYRRLLVRFELIEAGTVWIDGVQAEWGAEATPYEKGVLEP